MNPSTNNTSVNNTRTQSDSDSIVLFFRNLANNIEYLAHKVKRRDLLGFIDNTLDIYRLSCRDDALKPTIENRDGRGGDAKDKGVVGTSPTSRPYSIAADSKEKKENKTMMEQVTDLQRQRFMVSNSDDEDSSKDYTSYDSDGGYDEYDDETVMTLNITEGDRHDRIDSFSQESLLNYYPYHSFSQQASQQATQQAAPRVQPSDLRPSCSFWTGQEHKQTTQKKKESAKLTNPTRDPNASQVTHGKRSKNHTAKKLLQEKRKHIQSMLR